MIVGIVADDLTGAADSAAPFAGRGLSADVRWVTSGSPITEDETVDVRAWDTRTREMPAETGDTIRTLTAEATRRLKRHKPRIYFKKIDSTLRGHLRLELDAMRAELPGRIALICPAFPANERVVLSGRLWTGPDAGRSVREAFGMVGDPGSTVISLDEIRRAGPNLCGILHGLQPIGVNTVFFDAETSEDLGWIADVVLAHPEEFLPVGSAGLASALAARVPSQSASRPKSTRQRLMTSPVLVVVGSQNAVSRRQAHHLADSIGIEPVVLDACNGEHDTFLPVIQRFEAGVRIVLAVSPETHRQPEWLPVSFWSERLAQAAPDLCLVATGGDTAMSILDQLEFCDGIDLEGEFESGIVVGRLHFRATVGRLSRTMPILLKAGGFGDDQTLLRCFGGLDTGSLADQP